MPGMSLRTGFHAGGSFNSGGPLTPPATTTPTARPTIAQVAYGVNGSGAPMTGPKTAGVGGALIGYAALAGLVYLWWSLPR